MNAESLIQLVFLQHNFRGISCTYFRTFLNSSVQLLKKIHSTQMYEWACTKGDDLRTGDRLYAMCIKYTNLNNS